MRDSSSGRSASVPHTLGYDPTTSSVFLHAGYVEEGAAARSGSSRRIAVPPPGAVPSFDQVFGLALVGAHFDQAVLVIYMTEQVLNGWQCRLEERAGPVDGLDLLDGRFAWSVDWKAFFGSKRYDVIVLHGVLSALQTLSLPFSYVKRLVEAVPAGLVVLA